MKSQGPKSRLHGLCLSRGLWQTNNKAITGQAEMCWGQGAWVATETEQGSDVVLLWHLLKSEVSARAFLDPLEGDFF